MILPGISDALCTARFEKSIFGAKPSEDQIRENKYAAIMPIKIGSILTIPFPHKLHEIVTMIANSAITNA